MSHSIAGCIELAESALQHRKTQQAPEKPSPRLDRMGEILSGIERVDSSLTDCIKMAEDTLETEDHKIEEWMSTRTYLILVMENARLLKGGQSSGQMR